MGLSAAGNADFTVTAESSDNSYNVNNNNNNKVYLYYASPYINMFALSTLLNELRQTL